MFLIINVSGLPNLSELRAVSLCIGSFVHLGICAFVNCAFVHLYISQVSIYCRSNITDSLSSQVPGASP